MEDMQFLASHEMEVVAVTPTKHTKHEFFVPRYQLMSF